MWRFTRTALLAVVFFDVCGVATAQEPLKAKLVLQITVDGFRTDLLGRYAGSFGKGGFRHLLDNGTMYTNAHYSHANTETIVGHVTLSTGAHPSEHGMVGNVIFDRDNSQLAYNVEDADAPILPTRKETGEGAQVDPAQKKSRSAGRSPINILATTFADELSIHTAGKAKIFGISGKDRSAIAMAGYSGKAFWFSTDTGDFQTSKYYYDSYPDWVVAWNGLRKAHSYSGKSWELPGVLETYLNGHRDYRPYEADLKGYGRVFPHPFGSSDHPLFNTRILVSSVGDQLTADFAKTVLDNEELGRDDIPDYLSVSFSGVDAINHFFGPSSVENEAVIRDLDATIASLLAHVDKKVGLEHVLIVLSADHGTPEAPEYIAERGMKVGRINPDEVYKVAAAATRKAFGLDNLVLAFFRPYLYLSEKVITGAGLERAKVEDVAAHAIQKIDGIARAVTLSQLPTLQNNPLVSKIRRNTHPANSGDVYVVQQPFWYLLEGGPIAVMHGSPWSYDTHVPIIFAGPGIKQQTISRRVHPVSVAPTLSTLLGTKIPSSAFASPLKEVIDAKP